ncbi:hypothetical protein BJ165DRAFT_1458546 [Panaeolus papilionaceus]|nr:hypothetical protein BJ165DRAFT_1458546 [Panaeolus papilionaceus]
MYTIRTKRPGKYIATYSWSVERLLTFQHQTPTTRLSICCDKGVPLILELGWSNVHGNQAL